MNTAFELPFELTSFVGHERDQLELATLLQTAHLLTLVGPVGVGKSRLAARVARTFGIEQSARVLVVDVSLVAGAAQLASTVSRAVRVAAAERSKRTLLLFDNCDGLTEECAKLASSLANDASETTILATCRRRLGATIEASWQVDPLPVPSGEASPAEIMASAAVALFVDRASAVNARFMLVEADSPDIAQLCRRLDGLPLGLEHAAAKMVFDGGH